MNINNGEIEQCSECRFFQYAFPENHSTSEVGHCRRYPPVLSETALKTSIGEDGEFLDGIAVSCYFPMTADTDWCGEYALTSSVEFANDVIDAARLRAKHIRRKQ